MPFGTSLLQSVSQRKEEREAENKAACIRTLDQQGIPTPDHAQGDDDFVSFSYDIGGKYEMLFFSWTPEDGVEQFGISIPDGYIDYDDVKQGWCVLAEMRQAELKPLMPEASDNKLYILSWLHFADESIRRTEDARILLEDSSRLIGRGCS